MHRSLTLPEAFTMNMFDNLDFQGGSFGDASLDFIDTSNFESPQTAHPATVSPTELWNDEAIMSNPPSTAFPNLMTPSSEFLDSPDCSSGLNTDPLFDGVLDTELDMTSLDHMPSLFPDAQHNHFDSQPSIAPNASFEDLESLHNAYQPQQPQSSSAKASPMVRQKSSPGRPPIVHDRKASLSAGIMKANQKSRKDLPDIVIESEDDKETAKRKKNTAAARKSRQRKQETLGAMSAEISRLRAIIEAMGGDPDMEFSTP